MNRGRNFKLLLLLAFFAMLGCDKLDLPRNNPNDIASFKSRLIYWSCDSLNQVSSYGEWNLGGGSKAVKGLGFWNDVDFDSTVISMQYYSPLEHTVTYFYGQDNQPSIIVDDTLRESYFSDKGDSIYPTPMGSILYYTFTFRETQIIPPGHHELKFVFEADAITNHMNYLDEVSIWTK